MSIAGFAGAVPLKLITPETTAFPVGPAAAAGALPPACDTAPLALWSLPLPLPPQAAAAARTAAKNITRFIVPPPPSVIGRATAPAAAPASRAACRDRP